MVDVTFRFDGHGASIMTIMGHAGYADIGQDIVCSACTILAYTLAESILRYKHMDLLQEAPYFRLESGDIEVRCIPKEDYRAVVELLYEHTQTGFEMLSRAYPDNVRLTSFDDSFAELDINKKDSST